MSSIVRFFGIGFLFTSKTLAEALPQIIFCKRLRKRFRNRLQISILREGVDVKGKFLTFFSFSVFHSFFTVSSPTGRADGAESGASSSVRFPSGAFASGKNSSLWV